MKGLQLFWLPLLRSVLHIPGFAQALVMKYNSSYDGESVSIDHSTCDTSKTIGTSEASKALNDATKKNCTWPSNCDIFQTSKNRIPRRIASRIKDMNPSYRYHLWDDCAIESWMTDTRQSRELVAFRAGKSKWKADLFRIALLSQRGGVYSDVDIEWLVPFEEMFLQKADFYSILGPFGKPRGLSELHIGLLATNGPEPLLKEWLEAGTPEQIARGTPYAYNIHGICSLLRSWIGSDFGTNKLMWYKGRSYWLFQEIVVQEAEGQRAYAVDAQGNPIARTNYFDYGEFKPSEDAAAFES